MRLLNEWDGHHEYHLYRTFVKRLFSGVEMSKEVVRNEINGSLIESCLV